VIGTGADLVYPAAHHPLARQIAAQGAIVSEWPLGTPARSANFPQRNRVISALVEGVIVVEAAMRSGSLITARLANEMGRDIFALPGSIHAPLSRGCHRLIKEGAQLVETPEEVLEALGITQAAPSAQAASRAPRTGPATRRRSTKDAQTLPLEFTRPVNACLPLSATRPPHLKSSRNAPTWPRRCCRPPCCGSNWPATSARCRAGASCGPPTASAPPCYIRATCIIEQRWPPICQPRTTDSI
jgi:DNA processing protein